MPRSIVFLVAGFHFLIVLPLGRKMFGVSPALSISFVRGSMGVGALLSLVGLALLHRPDMQMTTWGQYVSSITLTVAALGLQHLSALEVLSFPPIIFVSAVIPLIIFCSYPARPMLAGVVIAFSTSVAIEFLSPQAGGIQAARIYGLLNIGLICIATVVTIDYLNRLSWLNLTVARLLGSTDPLTGLSTRADFNRTIVSRLKQAHRDKKTIALLLLDVDHFKLVNDQHGHLVGDSVLRGMGKLLRAGHADRPNDLKVRFGGEEILVFWYDISKEQVPIKVNGVLQAIRALVIEHNGAPYPLQITASAGVVYGVPAADVNSLELLGQADQLLYRAKREGRDQAQIVSFETVGSDPELLPRLQKFETPVTTANLV